MSKNDYHEKNKDVILNILKALIKELIKELTRELPENNPLIEGKKKKKRESIKKKII